MIVPIKYGPIVRCRRRWRAPAGLTYVRCPDLSLNDLLRLVSKPLRVTFSGLIGGLGRLQGGSRTLYLPLPAAKLGSLVFMLAYPQRLDGFALLLTRAPSFLHRGIHLGLRIAHTSRDGASSGQHKGC